MIKEQEQWHAHRHFLAWGLAAVVGIIAIFATIGLVLYYIPRPVAPVGTVYPYYGWGIGRLFFGLFLFFAFFWVLKLIFWGGWGWRYRRGYGGGYWGGHGYWRNRDTSYYILRERYAKGEITKEQYDQMMRDLDQHNTMP